MTRKTLPSSLLLSFETFKHHLKQFYDSGKQIHGDFMSAEFAFNEKISNLNKFSVDECIAIGSMLSLIKIVDFENVSNIDKSFIKLIENLESRDVKIPLMIEKIQRATNLWNAILHFNIKDSNEKETSIS